MKGLGQTVRVLGTLFRHITSGLTSAGGEIAAWAVLFITVAVTVDVLLRYVFNNPTKWVSEISSYLLVVLVSMGLAYTLRGKRHIRVTAIVSRLPKPLRLWLNVISSVAFLAFSIILFRFTWHLFTTSIKYKSTSLSIMEFPIAPAQVFMPVGLAILSLALIYDIYNDLKIILLQTKRGSLTK